MPEVVVVASPIIEGNQVSDSGSQVTIIQQKQISDLNSRLPIGKLEIDFRLKQKPDKVETHPLILGFNFIEH